MSKELKKILNLRCCQMALGMRAVKKKIKEYDGITRSQFLSESKKDPVVIVIGPDRKCYIVDGHHRALAAWLAGHKKIFVTTMHDYSHDSISRERFWRELKKKNCTHLYDQFGDGPHEPLYLPIDVRGLGDDPYRSLAWLAKEKHAYKETSDRFAGFKWANFYRNAKLLEGRQKKDFKSAAKKAVHLSHAKTARHLPGYTSSVHQSLKGEIYG